MRIIFLKLLIALAIGLAAGQIAGVSSKKTRYFLIGTGEISAEFYGNIAMDKEELTYKKEEFNKESYHLYGVLFFSGVLIILLIPEFLKKNKGQNI